MDQTPYPLGTNLIITGCLGDTYNQWKLSSCSKDGQGEGEAAVIAHQPVYQGIEPGTTESVNREESPEPPAPPS